MLAKPENNGDQSSSPMNPTVTLTTQTDILGYGGDLSRPGQRFHSGNIVKHIQYGGSLVIWEGISWDGCTKLCVLC